MQFSQNFSNNVGIVDDARCDLHFQTTDHPECPSRTMAIRKYLVKSGLYNKLVKLETKPINVEKLLQTHSKQYVDDVFRLCEKPACFLSMCGDVKMNNPNSFMAALVAAGSGITAVDAILDPTQHTNRVFCNVRPPGHHAYREKTMGFCVFNNVAIAANHALSFDNIKRVLIVDFDVHHGNGTEQIFLNDPRVLYVSLHREPPFYPNTGHVWQKGVNNTNINVPLNSQTDEKSYLEYFDKLIPKMRKFNPHMIFISCGFDGHCDDPMKGLNLSENAFAKMTSDLCLLANEFCGGKIVSMLEGGYNISAIPRCAYVHILKLLES